MKHATFDPFAGKPISTIYPAYESGFYGHMRGPGPLGRIGIPACGDYGKAEGCECSVPQVHHLQIRLPV